MSFYIRFKNFPLKELKKPKHGNGNKLGWDNYGINKNLIRSTALQYIDGNGDWVQILPIGNPSIYNQNQNTLQEDVELHNNASVELINDNDDTLYPTWEALRDAYLNPPEA
jgi:hypothetical protein